MNRLSPDEPSCPVIKRLLENRGTVWLFMVSRGEHVTHQVEVDDRQWTFGLRFVAESKFRREVARQEREAKAPHIIYQPTSSNAILGQPGASETAEDGDS
jgi:hypothetical protein